MIDRLLPIAASEHAATFDAVLTSVHLHIAIQAIAWGAFLMFCLVHFRQGRQPHASHRGIPPLLPILAIAAEIVGDGVLLATTALPAWRARPPMPPAALQPIEVRVVAEQFAWNIHYPGRIVDSASPPRH